MIVCAYSVTAVGGNNRRVCLRDPAQKIFEPCIEMAGISARRPHRIEWVAIFFFYSRANGTLVARTPEAGVGQAQVVTKFMAQYANIEVIISQPNARSADVCHRPEHQERLGPCADHIR